MDETQTKTTPESVSVPMEPPPQYTASAAPVAPTAYPTAQAAYPTAPAPPYVYNPYADQHNDNVPQKQMQIASGGDYHPGHSGRTGLVDAEVIQGDEAAIPQGQRVIRRTVIVRRNNTQRWACLGIYLVIKVIVIIVLVIHFNQ